MLPTIAFKPGIAARYDLTRHTRNFDARLHEMRLAPGSAPLPKGVTLDPSGTLTYDGTTSATSAAGLAIDIRDVASSE